jgi:hypothetical protein
MIKVGDIFEIPLSNNRKAVGHFVFKDKKNGPLIQVFNDITDNEKVNIEDAINSNYLFPPVLTGLYAAIRVGLWHIIGKMPVTNFTYPKFISSVWDDQSGEVKNWFVWDIEKFVKLGPILPEEYKTLEYMVVWSPQDIVYRIETGSIPFPFGEMIKNNKFTPTLENKKTKN